jgi:hypothetical protein
VHRHGGLPGSNFSDHERLRPRPLPPPAHPELKNLTGTEKVLLSHARVGRRSLPSAPTLREGRTDQARMAYGQARWRSGLSTRTLEGRASQAGGPPARLGEGLARCYGPAGLSVGSVARASRSHSSIKAGIKPVRRL